MSIDRFGGDFVVCISTVENGRSATGTRSQANLGLRLAACMLFVATVGAGAQPGVPAATLSQSGSCSVGGSEVRLKNDSSKVSVSVTVRITWNMNAKTGSYDRQFDVSAGAEKYIGCTRGGPTGGEQYAYSVSATVAK